MQIDKHMAHVLGIKLVHVVFHTQNVNKHNSSNINHHHHVNGSHNGDASNK